MYVGRVNVTVIRLCSSLGDKVELTAQMTFCLGFVINDVVRAKQ